MGKVVARRRRIVARFVPEALHILKTYSFRDSFTGGHVAQIIEEAFWMAYKRPSIEVYSSRGVLPTTKVRSSSDGCPSSSVEFP